MATVPMKSQPLHNFSLEYLKWGSKNLMNKSSSHRHRRLESSSTSQTLKRRRSPPTERRSQEEEEEVEVEVEEEHRASSAADSVPSSTRPPKKQFGAAACSASAEKSQKVSKKESDGGMECAAPAEEGHEKPWNLRPRRAPAVHSAEKSPPSPKQPKSLRLRGSADTQKGPEKKQDKKLWISLSKDEIERDIFALTGSKPARKPKKRPRTEQKVLDNIFPGLWLAGMTAVAYQPPEAPSKP